VSVPFAYLGVIVIWSTTPLAIQWSGEGAGYLFGVTARMTLGAVLAGLAQGLLRVELPRHRTARMTYLAAGIGIYSAMLAVYWSSQYIPSGWMSVIFGLAPLLTGAMARLWLGERALTVNRLTGMSVSLGGLVVIFWAGLGLGQGAVYGVLGMLAAVSFHSASAVWVKRLGADLPGLAVATGGLWVAAPLFLLTWLFADKGLPVTLPLRAGVSIGYLALFGSVLGLALYFYVLRHMEVGRVALITLITPVAAMMLGQLLNGEPVSPSAYVGMLLILLGLAIYQWGARCWRRISA